MYDDASKISKALEAILIQKFFANKRRNMNNKKYGYLAKNTLFFTISSFGSKFLGFFLVPLYTNVLTTEDYGTVDLLTTLTTLLVYILTLDIADAVLRFAIERKEKQEEILNYGFKISLIGSLILAITLFICYALNLNLWQDYCYFFLFFYFISFCFYNILSNYLRAIDKVKALSIAGIILTIVTIASNIILLIIFKLGVIGYLVSMILGNLVAGIFCFIKSDVKNVFKNHCDKETKKAMLYYSIPLIFNGISWWANSSINKFFIASMCGVAINGIFAVAQKIPLLLTTAHGVFSQAWQLSVIKEFDPNDKDGFFCKTFSFYNSLLVLMCSGVILVNLPLAKILFAKDFFIAWQCSSILTLSVVFSALGGFVGTVFTAVKNSRIFAISTISTAIVNCILCYLLIPIYGARGGAIATVISFATMYFIRLACSRKYIKFKLNLFKDIFAYSLLVLQVFFENFENHFYIGQLSILLILMILYRKQLTKIATTLFLKIKILFSKTPFNKKDDSI